MPAVGREYADGGTNEFPGASQIHSDAEHRGGTDRAVPGTQLSATRTTRRGPSVPATPGISAGASGTATEHLVSGRPGASSARRPETDADSTSRLRFAGTGF